MLELTGDLPLSSSKITEMISPHYLLQKHDLNLEGSVKWSSSNTIVDQCIRASKWKDLGKDGDDKISKMDLFMRETGLMIFHQGVACSLRLTEENTREHLKKEKVSATENMLTAIKRFPMKDNSKMISSMVSALK